MEQEKVFQIPQANIDAADETIQPGTTGQHQQQESIVKQQDKRSVFLQNVDYGSTKQELETIFKDCGKITRITILKDKFTNNPRGLAYVEFQDIQSVENAIMLSGVQLRNRFIRISVKRTNIKGLGKPKKKNNFFKDPTAMLLQSLLGVMGPKKFLKK